MHSGVKTTNWGVNIDNSKSDVGSRGTNSKTLPLSYKPGAQVNGMVSNMPGTNIFPSEMNSSNG